MNESASPRSLYLLGVRIDNFSNSETRQWVEKALDGIRGAKFITTLNPEIILKARQEESYKEVLNSADLNVCDGFGLRLVSFLKNIPIKARFAGVDLVDFLLDKAWRDKIKVLVVVANNSLSKPGEIELSISRKYPNISVKSEYFSTGQEWFENDIIKQAEIVFVNFGAPKQEKFIFEHRSRFPNARILVGVGGTFDFLTGKIRRAPKWMRFLGLEWLWRLAQEPKRIRRIWNAVVVFPVKALFSCHPHGSRGSRDS